MHGCENTAAVEHERGQKPAYHEDTDVKFEFGIFSQRRQASAYNDGVIEREICCSQKKEDGRDPFYICSIEMTDIFIIGGKSAGGDCAERESHGVEKTQAAK